MKQQNKIILKRKSTTSVAKIAATPSKTDKVRLKLKKNIEYATEGAVGGVHAHALLASNPSITDKDGAHSHIFMVNGRPFISDWDGEHEHEILAKDNKTGPNTAHDHRVLVDNDTFNTDEGVSHEHELQVLSTVQDGLHRHSLTLLDNTVVESLLPSDILTASIAKAKYNLAIQQLKFDVSRFPNTEDAQKWAVENGYTIATSVPDGTALSHVFQQLHRDQFVETSLIEMKLVDGVSAVFGVLQPKDIGASLHPSQDTEFLSYNMMQDRVTRGEEILSVEDRTNLLNLKDNLKSSLVELKFNLNQHLEAIGTLIGTIEDESQKKVFERYKSTYEIVMQELNEVEVEREPTDAELNAKDVNPLDVIMSIEKDAVELQEALDESSLQSFADLLGSFILTTEKVLRLDITKGGEGSGGSREGAGRPASSGSKKPEGSGSRGSGDKNSAVNRTVRRQARLSASAKSMSNFAKTSNSIKAGIQRVKANKSWSAHIKSIKDAKREVRKFITEIAKFTEDQKFLDAVSDFIKNAGELTDEKVTAFASENKYDLQEVYDALAQLHLEAEALAEVEAEKNTQKYSVKTPFNFNIPMHIKKDASAAEERMVFGIVLEPNDGGDKGIPLTPDEHGDIYGQEDVKKAAYSFMEDDDAGNHGFMHKFFMNEDFTLLENFVTKGKTFIETEGSGVIELRKGTWVMGIRVNSDNIWKMVKNGEITGFSIGGIAEVEELMEIKLNKEA